MSEDIGTVVLVMISVLVGWFIAILQIYYGKR